MTDGSRNRHREPLGGMEADGLLREPGLDDRPECLDGEDDLRVNLRVMVPIPSSMNSWSVVWGGTEGQDCGDAEHGEAVRLCPNRRFESSHVVVTGLPFCPTSVIALPVSKPEIALFLRPILSNIII